ncbi:MAG: nucleoside deaminase [Planctomycetota bacterium]
MTRAARLALDGVASGQGGPFGAVVVDPDGNVIGASCNRVLGTNDPTAHAEVEAIRQAAQARGDFSLKGCTIYTTCEPCPMCLAAIHWARIDKVVFAMTRRDAADAGFDDAIIHDAITRPTVPLERIASPGAAQAFRAWSTKTDKRAY